MHAIVLIVVGLAAISKAAVADDATVFVTITACGPEATPPGTTTYEVSVATTAVPVTSVATNTETATAAIPSTYSFFPTTVMASNLTSVSSLVGSSESVTVMSTLTSNTVYPTTTESAPKASSTNGAIEVTVSGLLLGGLTFANVFLV